MILTPISAQDWTSSSYSQGNGGECVEWAPGYASTTGVVPVRDSKVTDGPVLMLTPAAFAGLVTLARSTA
ncbi:DUF397 domain-containing protein [Streptomyces sp. NPDC088789]|uniref:DUF397 domain-containing protein n=1 Tax=Streptomyces sp. NPDC088789 TaxID=3365899 RepID=UPI0038061296